MTLFKQLATDFGSYAKDKSIAKWCDKTWWDKTGFPASKSFSVSKYGFANARNLAEEVIRRGDYFLGAWIDAGRTVPLDFSDLRAGCTSPPECQEWFEDLPLKSHSSNAAFDVGELAPCPIISSQDVR